MKILAVNKTISISEDLDSMIEKFNLRNPFDKLNISQIAQKAIYQKISKEDPELILEIEKKEPIKPIEQIKPIQKPIQNQHLFELVCIQCGKSFTAKSKLAKTCSDQCRSALSRKTRKSKVTSTS